MYTTTISAHRAQVLLRLVRRTVLPHTQGVFNPVPAARGINRIVLRNLWEHIWGRSIGDIAPIAGGTPQECARWRGYRLPIRNVAGNTGNQPGGFAQIRTPWIVSPNHTRQVEISPGRERPSNGCHAKARGPPVNSPRVQRGLPRWGARRRAGTSLNPMHWCRACGARFCSVLVPPERPGLFTGGPRAPRALLHRWTPSQPWGRPGKGISLQGAAQPRRPAGPFSNPSSLIQGYTWIDLHALSGLTSSKFKPFGTSSLACRTGACRRLELKRQDLRILTHHEVP